MSFVANITRRRKTKVSNYLTALSQELVLILQESGTAGVDIFEYVLSEHDGVWQIPPIETDYVHRKYYANFLKDIKSVLKHSLGDWRKIHSQWSAIADKVITGKPDEYISQVGYTGIYAVTGLSAVDSKLIFAPPTLEAAGTQAAKCLFLVESAAFFHSVFDFELHRDEQTYCIDIGGGITGVHSGKLYYQGLCIGDVSKELLNISLRLPRGPGYEMYTKDTIDAIRTWATENQPAQSEYLLDVLSILRLAKPGEHLIALNTLLLQMQPLKKPRKYIAYHDRDRVREARKVLSMEQRELDYVKVQDILNDPSRVDRVKLLDMAEIIVPLYMSQSTFVNTIGYPATKNTTAATFSKARYDKMLAGWSKFRDASLEKARSKLTIKFEDR